MPPLRSLTLEEVSRMFKKDSEWYFESYEDGFFTFFTNDESLSYSFTFKPTEYAHFKNCSSIDDLLAVVDTNHHFGVKMDL